MLNIDINYINSVLERCNQTLRLDTVEFKHRRCIIMSFNNKYEIRYANIRNKFLHNIEHADELITFNSKFFDMRYSLNVEDVEKINEAYYWYYTYKGLNSPNKYRWGKGHVPVNKGVKGGVGWSRGLNKTNDVRFAKMSEDRKGSKNPMFGVPYTEEKKQKQSEHMKNMIETGQFTPKTENRLSRWKVVYNEMYFRSSWELAFYYINKDCLYEKIRLRYFDTVKNKERIYIVDFVDENKKILYEVRPKSLQKNMTDKLVSVDKYTQENGYSFVFIDEDYIKTIKPKIEISDLPDDVKEKIRKVK